MKNISKFLTAIFVLLFSFSVSAQVYSGFSDASIVLKSDTNTKSVLISNLLSDRVGDISPIIGAAAWKDNGKKLQCRSLLWFDYGILPLVIDPEQITQAKLILRPVEMNTVEKANASWQPQEFVVRRVLESWEDSMTSWITQPIASPEDEAVKYLSENKVGKTVRVDVTELVKNMFRYGNNGFMIGYRDSMESESFLSQWFASARNEVKKLRPELLINYSLPTYNSYLVSDIWPVYRGFTPTRSAIGMIQQYPIQQPIINSPAPTQQLPQQTPQPPIKVPVQDNPPSPPPKSTPVKDQENR